MDPYYFQVTTPLGVLVRTTPAYWARIITFKHPIMRGREEAVIDALANPEQVRQSRNDPAVFLYYRKDGAYLTCVVVRHLNGEGFVITAYRTDAAKEGSPIWPR